jgi:hypothetical protein
MATTIYKQQNYVARFQQLTVQFMANVDALTALTNEYVNDQYGLGQANAIPDTVVQNVLPAASATALSNAQAALVGPINPPQTTTLLAMVATIRAQLEQMRP